MIVAMRCLSLLAVFSAVVFAGDDICPELQWKLDSKGRILVWPHPALGAAAKDEPDARPYMERGPRLFASELPRTGLLGMTLYALPGTTDLASLGDGAYQFQKLNTPATDAAIVERIAMAPEGVAPLLRRAQLDRLLAVRIAQTRRLEAALPALAKLAKEADAPFLKRAAVEARAGILGLAPPALKVAELPRDIPANADLVVFIDQTRVPRWTRLWSLTKQDGSIQARNMILQLGTMITVSDRARGQLTMDLPLVLGYEAARQFGNMRRHWTVVAARLAHGADGPAIWSETDGLFDPAALHAALERHNVTSEFKEGVCRFAVLGIRIEMQRTRLSVRMGAFPATDAPAPRIPRGHAVWGLVRLSKKAQRLVPRGLATGAKQATFTVDLERRFVARLQTEYASEAAAAQALGVFEQMCQGLDDKVMLDPIQSDRTGTTVSVAVDLRTSLENYLAARYERLNAKVAGK